MDRIDHASNGAGAAQSEGFPEEVEEYIRAKTAISDAADKREIFKARAQEQANRITRIFNKQLGQLENKKSMKLSRIWGRSEALTRNANEKITRLAETLQVTDRRIAFLMEHDKIEAATAEVDKNLIKPRHQGELVWLEDLRREKYLHLTLLIAENGRPKNKYSLAIRGKCSLAGFIKQPPSIDYTTSLNEYGSGANIEGTVRTASTVEELKIWARQKRDKIVDGFLAQYDQTKKDYLETISNHTLKDYERILTVREIPDTEAPIAFKITEGEKTTPMRIYDRAYYAPCTDKDKPEYPHVLDYIQVAGVVYVRLCRVESLEIKQSGNLTFSDWWSTSIAPGQPTSKNRFNQHNYERTITETTAWLKKRTGTNYDKLSWNPPTVEWLRPDLLPK